MYYIRPLTIVAKISVNFLKMTILDILSSAMCRKMLDCKRYAKGYENTQTK